MDFAHFVGVTTFAPNMWRTISYRCSSYYYYYDYDYVEQRFCREMHTGSIPTIYRGKLGNGEHLSFKAYKHKHNDIFVTIIR